MLLHTFSTLGCPELDLDGAISLAARHGMTALELRTLGGSTDLPAWFRKNLQTPAALAAHLKRRRAKICVLDTSFTVIGHTPEDRAKLVEYVEWADGADVPWLRVIDGGTRGDAAEIDQMADTLRWWREQRLKNCWAVELAVETHEGFIRGESIQALIAKCPHVSFVWDVHHTWKRGGEAPAATWKAIRNHAVHVHVKDSVSQPSPDGKTPFTYVLPGDGEFPIRDVLQLLVNDRFHGVISLEWPRTWHPELPEIDKALYYAKQKHWW